MLIEKDSEEFKARYAKLRPECSIALDALEKHGDIETWPKHLQKDVMRRMGLKPVVRYEVLDAQPTPEADLESLKRELTGHEEGSMRHSEWDIAVCTTIDDLHKRGLLTLGKGEPNNSTEERLKDEP